MVSEVVDGSLKQQCHARDSWCCRLCGRGDVGLDAHHIRFRRSTADDVLWNVVSLCRECHQLVHDNRLMTKRAMQEILWELTTELGVTGLQLIRWKRRQANKEKA